MDWVEAEGATRVDAEKMILDALGVSDTEKVEFEEMKVTRKFLGMGGRTVKLRGRKLASVARAQVETEVATMEEPVVAEESHDDEPEKVQAQEPVGETVKQVAQELEPEVEEPEPVIEPEAAKPEEKAADVSAPSENNKYHHWEEEGPQAIIIPPRGQGFGRRKYSANPDDDTPHKAPEEDSYDNNYSNGEERDSDAEEFVPTVISDDPESPVTDEDRDKAVSFIKNILVHMGMDGEVFGHKLADRLLVQIDSESGGLLIGRKGSTLESLQYLADIAVNRKREDRLRVILDTEHYKERRRFKIYQIAMDAANKVVHKKRPVRLAPMSPAERQIIHSSLAENSSVETISEGQGNRRRVVVYLKGDRTKGGFNKGYEKGGGHHRR